MDPLSHKHYIDEEGEHPIKKLRMTEEESDSDIDDEVNLAGIKKIDDLYEAFTEFAATGSKDYQVILKSDSQAKGTIEVAVKDEDQLQKLLKEGWQIGSSRLNDNDEIISYILVYTTTFAKISSLIDVFVNDEMGVLNQSAKNKIREILDYKQNIPPYIIPRKVIRLLRRYAEKEMGYSPVAPKESKYDQQFIFDLGTGMTAKALKKKRKFVYNKSSEIFNYPQLVQMGSEPSQKFASRVTLCSRIYLVGHSGSSLDFIASEKKEKLSADDLVKILGAADHLKVENLKTYEGQRLNIHIIGCYSANMANQVAKKLSALNIPAVVSGAQGTTLKALLFDGMEQEYFKSVESEGHDWHKRGKATYYSSQV